MLRRVWLFCDCMAASDEYRARQQDWTGRRQESDRLFIQLGNARLVLGITEAILAYLVFGRELIPAFTLAIPIVLFVVLAVWQSRAVRRRTLADRALKFYARGLARLDDKWVGSGSFGEQFRDGSHVYAEDLDLFGKGSLFELVAETRTAAAEKMLASWLLSPATAAEASERQRAVEELRSGLDLREHFSLLGPDVQAEVSVEALARWGEAPTVHFPAVLRPICAVLACISVTLLVAFFAGRVAFLPLVAVIGLDLAIGFALRSKVKACSRRPRHGQPRTADPFSCACQLRKANVPIAITRSAKGCAPRGRNTRFPPSRSTGPVGRLARLGRPRAHSSPQAAPVLAGTDSHGRGAVATGLRSACRFVAARASDFRGTFFFRVS